MTRLDPAATVTGAIKALAGIGAVLVLSVAASGCIGGGAAPAPTPDPFAGLADRSDQAFRDGLELYGQGQYSDALAAFDRARLLSPTGDPRIEQMIARSRAALAPTATPVPPTATAVPAPPKPTPVAMSTQIPDTALGQRYFGEVSLAVVPTRDMDSPATTRFFFQDQIGVRIEGLKQHLRLPFSMRVFNTDTSTLVGEVHSDDGGAVAAATQTGVRSAANVSPQGAAVGLSPAEVKSMAPSGQPRAADASPTATTSTDSKLTTFFDSYVWYHQGAEGPGHYRVELYASGVLTNTLDFSVSSEPVPTPEPTLSPTVAPTPTIELPRAPAEPASSFTPPPPPVVTQPRPTQAPAAPARVAPPMPVIPTAVSTQMPEPTPMPTPATAQAALVGGQPAGIDVNAADGQVFIADSSGSLWSSDAGDPFVFKRPIVLGSQPVDVAVDESTGNVFVSARSESAVVVLDANGRRLSSIAMPVAPGDLQVDSRLGLLYVVLPDRGALGVIDTRAGRLLRTVDNLPQVSALALDPERHTLYVSQVPGQVSVIDVTSSRVTARVSVTGFGLHSVATARGLVYGINDATHELAVFEPQTQAVSMYPLDVEPAAITASEDDGSVYILAPASKVVVRLDPTDGAELGRVILPAAASTSPAAGLQARLVLNRADQSLYATMPEAGSLAVVAADLFPGISYDIPWVKTPQSPLQAGQGPVTSDGEAN